MWQREPPGTPHLRSRLSTPFSQASLGSSLPSAPSSPADRGGPLAYLSVLYCPPALAGHCQVPVERPSSPPGAPECHPGARVGGRRGSRRTPDSRCASRRSAARSPCGVVGAKRPVGEGMAAVDWRRAHLVVRVVAATEVTQFTEIVAGVIRRHALCVHYCRLPYP